MRLMTFVSTQLMERSVYEALDTDHHGYPLREVDKQTVHRYRKRLPGQASSESECPCHFKAQHQHWWRLGERYSSCCHPLHPSCIAIAKLANPVHKYPVPRFRQHIEICGASYSILHQQFPLQLAYGLCYDSTPYSGLYCSKGNSMLGRDVFCLWSSLSSSKQSQNSQWPSFVGISSLWHIP